MTVSKALVRASKRMAFWSKAAVVITPLSTMLLFLFPDQVRMVGGDFSVTAHYGHILSNSLLLSDRLIAMGFAMIPTAVATWGMVALVRLFKRLGEGEVFSPEALRAFSDIATALFWNVLATIATEPAITYFLSRGHTPVHLYTQITLGADDVELLFLAGIAYVIARVMAEARVVAEENAKFV